MAKRQATSKSKKTEVKTEEQPPVETTKETIENGDGAENAKETPQITEVNMKKKEVTEVNYDALRQSVETKTAALYRDLISLQREAKKKGEPYAARYTNFYKAIQQNCKKLKIDLPKKSDIF